MSEKYCPSLEDKGSGWSPNYYCQITGEKIRTGYEPYKSFCGNYEHYGSEGWGNCPHRKQSSNGCFLTSACVEAIGLPDNCHELTVLRQFRDGWLKQQPYGECAIGEYYHVAPLIVEVIHTKANSREIYENIYREMVLPCVKMIEDMQYDKAYMLYCSYTTELTKVYSIRTV